jgi:flavin reductase (DIM6/NTAB) family NADH-FMN oxidoreductase RutF
MLEEESAVMGATTLAEARRAHSLLPRGVYLLTACFDGRRAGQIVESVQPCSAEPLLVCIAALKGHCIEPLIRDSRGFAVCGIDPDDKLLLRRFSVARTPQSPGDPFDALEIDHLTTTAPIPRRCRMALDCEVVRHLDLESDHGLYIGRVLAGRIYSGQV